VKANHEPDTAKVSTTKAHQGNELEVGDYPSVAALAARNEIVY
jgi:hypothetical protein